MGSLRLFIPSRIFPLRCCSCGDRWMASSETTTNSVFPTPKIRSHRKLLYREAHVIQPVKEHRATVVWLHGRGDVGSSWADAFEDFSLQNVKMIFPTAPIQPITALGGYNCSAWFDGRPVSDGSDDLEGLDASAAHVAELLSQESPSVKLGVGGFSQGAATSLYITACSLIGFYSDGTRFPCKFDFTVALSGWLPSARFIQRRFHDSPNVIEETKDYSFFLGHGTDDTVVLYKLGEESASTLQSLGFSNLTFKSYKGLGHWSNDIEMQDVCNFIKKRISGLHQRRLPSDNTSTR
ncbi:hypothetical protein KP509_15G042700 [Ceratopteris richardii]|uniref:Phospholipase/carboxylesterase/thioesterase domain-containing protein n=1 Tax=Ceratopteris richardii TaxID=49495 RepID=A0A8T2T7L2_CERRI|nr:hypothetical protein KP509_15G042700 [Ceratopteris richardii]